MNFSEFFLRMGYGGDEIGAIVVDVGSSTLRAGFSGKGLKFAKQITQKFDF